MKHQFSEFYIFKIMTTVFKDKTNLQIYTNPQIFIRKFVYIRVFVLSFKEIARGERILPPRALLRSYRRPVTCRTASDPGLKPCYRASAV